MRTGDSFPLGERTGCSRRTEMKREREGERGGGKKITKSQITDGLIPFLKAASGGGRGRRKGGRRGAGYVFRPFAMAAYFFVLIPPCLLTSKAPALWRSRTECDWEILGVFLAKALSRPEGTAYDFFFLSLSLPLFLFSSSASFVVSQWTSGFVPRRKSLGSDTESALELHHRSCLLIGASRLVPEILFFSSSSSSSSIAFLMVPCGEMKTRHIPALQPARKKGLNNVTRMSLGWIRQPEGGKSGLSRCKREWQIQCRRITIISFIKSNSRNQLLKGDESH